MLHKIPSLGPEILTPHPVLVLGTPNARAQGPGASTHILVNMKAIFKKRQARSMCCVPAFIFNVFPLGSLWFTTLTYCGDLHWVFFPHGDCDFFLQWTTASWRAPFTLLPCNFSQCPCAGQRGSSGGALSLGAANQPSEWHQRLERGSWSKVAPNGIEGELLACLEPWFHSIARKELVFLPELNPCTLHPWTHWCVGRSPHRLRPRPKISHARRLWTFAFPPHMPGGRRRCARTYPQWLCDWFRGQDELEGKSSQWGAWRALQTAAAVMWPVVPSSF